MESQHGCPVFNTGPLEAFMIHYYIAFSSIAMLIGVSLVIYGGRYPKTTIFTIITLAVMMALLLLLWIYCLPESAPEWLVWISLVNCFFLGLGIGIAGAYWPRFGVEVLGAIIGLAVGYGLYEVIEIMVPEGNLTAAIACCLTIGGLAGIGIVFCLFDYAVIFCSSGIGAYMLIRGLASLLGGYPSELEIGLASNNDSIGYLPNSLYLYWTCMFLVWVLSMMG
mmetsp:Transcript_29415/g.21274  ORF Transcript_29415/g.21274 Transcript_29415/m.21274 type:complete len:223 (-) Transcript_29415:213-881(-)|eukprot:CAMPEP_0116873440 /NCGR_PEP_ID=MMETSP0463-20121206/4551_1 /TAXON_ID=181622 /ORGANISM="Strombidinopsis sp, Strain SopsisLIS2011" /LENGTH=222 /DNA_ID=CAMNT_0004515385 /DNA_START=507 /DNA_END=1175 /DNA_ORIENTATION=+